jgi:PPOX class probable F420-dependent enzyme
VATPVWVVAPDGGRVGFWTSSGSGTAKRLGHPGWVAVQACDARGKVTAGSAPVDATAELVTDARNDEIRDKVVAEYGSQTKTTKPLGAIGGTLKGERIPYGDIGVVIAPARGHDGRAASVPVAPARSGTQRADARVTLTAR